MPPWSRKKRKEAPPRLFQQNTTGHFSRMPSVVFAATQPSPLPPGAFVDNAAAGYSPIYYVPGVPQTPVVGYQPNHLPQQPPIQTPPSAQGGSSDPDSPTRLEELETMQTRLRELIAQEKGNLSSSSTASNGIPRVAGRQPRRRLRRRVFEEKTKQPSTPIIGDAAEKSLKSTSKGSRLHVCSDCDKVRSGLFQKLHGSIERRNFCTGCQIRRLKKHKKGPSFPIEHFCFQCGQARTKGFLKANPEAEKNILANICEECLLYSKSRQHVPETSIIGSDGDYQEVSCLTFAALISQSLVGILTAQTVSCGLCTGLSVPSHPRGWHF